MTLTELKTLIQNYIENDETTFVNTLNDMIINTEERIAELIEFDYFRKKSKAKKMKRGGLVNIKGQGIVMRERLR